MNMRSQSKPEKRRKLWYRIGAFCLAVLLVGGVILSLVYSVQAATDEPAPLAESSSLEDCGEFPTIDYGIIS
jgi:hypothetical protein